MRLKHVNLTARNADRLAAFYRNTFGFAERCALADIDPRVNRRTSKRPTDTELRVRMKELAAERRRFWPRSSPYLGQPSIEH